MHTLLKSVREINDDYRGNPLAERVQTVQVTVSYRELYAHLTTLLHVVWVILLQFVDVCRSVVVVLS